MSEAQEVGRVYVHRTQRVRFQDVDHAGIVFFAKIYEYCHVAYEDFVEEVLGLGPQAFFDARKLGAPLVATASDHRHPLFHGDRMRIDVRVAKLGRSSMTMAYEVFNHEEKICALVTMKHAFVSRQEGFVAIPIPGEIRQRLTPYLISSGPPS